MTEWLHPGLIFLIGALPIGLFGGRARQLWLLLIPLLALISVVLMLLASPTDAVHWRHQFVGQEMVLLRVDKLSVLFALVFTLMALIGVIYALHLRAVAEHMAAFLYVGSALGVVFAGDYLTLFVFWEIMAFSSAWLIFARRNPRSTAAGFRYLLVHITGGVCLLAGIVLQIADTGSAEFSVFEVQGGLAFSLILLGFLLNAAVPPLSAWLTDAYPEATITGAVFLSAFTTKTAVYVLLRACPGTEILIWLGAVMTIYGVVYAVLENDCRRLLAYHIVSQVGFMVCGVGLGTELAQNGAGAHAFAHILYKGLLFMAVGTVIFMTGRSKLTELGGLYRTMPLTLLLYMVGAVSISAFPLFSGFVSKAMVVAASEQDQRTLVYLMLTLASSGTFLSIGLKLSYHAFFGKTDDPPPLRRESGQTTEAPVNMLVAMSIAALLCLIIGLFPNLLYSLLPWPVMFEPYSAAHVTDSLSFLLFTALGFVLMFRYLNPEDRVSLDTDWFYRKGARVFSWFAHHPVARYEGGVSELANTLVLRSLYACAAAGLWFDRHVIDGVVNGLARFSLHGAAKLRRLQSGMLGHYALAMIVGIVLCIAVYAVISRTAPLMALLIPAGGN